MEGDRDSDQEGHGFSEARLTFCSSSFAQRAS